MGVADREVFLRPSGSAVVEKARESIKAPDQHTDHLFPYSLNTDPGALGAVAYCGHRRTKPWDGRIYYGRAERNTCVVCVEMARAEGW